MPRSPGLPLQPQPASRASVNTHTAYRSPGPPNQPSSPAPPPRTDTRVAVAEKHTVACVPRHGAQWLSFWMSRGHSPKLDSSVFCPTHAARGDPGVLWSVAARDKGARRRAKAPMHPLLVPPSDRSAAQHAIASPQPAQRSWFIHIHHGTVPRRESPVAAAALTAGRPRLYRAAPLRRGVGHVHPPPDRRRRRRLPRPPPRQPQAAVRRRDGHGRHPGLRDALHGLGQHGPLRQQRRLPLPLRQPRVPGGRGGTSNTDRAN